MPKAKLLAAIAGKNRGILATTTDRQAILAAIAELELRNPHPRPLTTAIDLLAGDWRRLRTSQISKRVSGGIRRMMWQRPAALRRICAMAPSSVMTDNSSPHALLCVQLTTIPG